MCPNGIATGEDHSSAESTDESIFNPTTSLRRSLRRQFRGARRTLSDKQQRTHALRLQRRFSTTTPAWRTGPVAGYVANDGEISVTPLLDALHSRGRHIALPVVTAGTTAHAPRMQFSIVDQTTAFEPGPFGITEPVVRTPIHPSALSLVLVPLVAFDTAGNRLGMGGGYYDRCFGRVPRTMRPLLIGVAHSLQLSEALPKAPWDIPLDGVITERACYTFSSRFRSMES